MKPLSSFLVVALASLKLLACGNPASAGEPGMPNNMGTINLVFNASSMSATATADGSPQLTFTVGGSSVACQLVNPTTVDASQDVEQRSWRRSRSIGGPVGAETGEWRL